MEQYDPKIVILPIIQANQALIKEDRKRAIPKLIDLIVKQSYGKIDYFTAKAYLEALI